MTVGEKIAKCRKEKKLSQIELAKKISTTAQNISQYERGVRNPKWDTLLKIAEALEVSIFELADDKTIDAHSRVINTQIDTSNFRSIEEINDPDELKKMLLNRSMSSLRDRLKILQLTSENAFHDNANCTELTEHDKRLQAINQKIAMLSEKKLAVLESLLDAIAEDIKTTADDD